MNQDNQTVVSGELMKRLKELGLDKNYSAVPGSLEDEARRLLGPKELADMDEKFRQAVEDAVEKIR